MGCSAVLLAIAGFLALLSFLADRYYGEELSRMATTHPDYIIYTSVIVALLLAALVGLALDTLGASGDVLWVPTIGTFVAGAFVVVKECPYCKKLVFRGSTQCLECTAERLDKPT